MRGMVNSILRPLADYGRETATPVTPLTEGETMRFKSEKVGGFQIFAVTGVNTVSFGIDAAAKAKKGLLGFAVERTDPSGKSKTIRGFKVFKSLLPKPTPKDLISTREH